MELDTYVANEVRAWLGRRRLSAAAAARRIGWTQPYLARRLNGMTTFTVTDLGALGQLLGVAPAAFLEGAPVSELAMARGDSHFRSSSSRYALAC